ncbi:MAG: hypothetical protein R2735_00370 [Microthrixaceae bacterium]
MGFSTGEKSDRTLRLSDIGANVVVLSSWGDQHHLQLDSEGAHDAFCFEPFRLIRQITNRSTSGRDRRGIALSGCSSNDKDETAKPGESGARPSSWSPMAN